MLGGVRRARLLVYLGVSVLGCARGKVSETELGAQRAPAGSNWGAAPPPAPRAPPPASASPAVSASSPAPASAAPASAAEVGGLVGGAGSVRAEASEPS